MWISCILVFLYWWICNEPFSEFRRSYTKLNRSESKYEYILLSSLFLKILCGFLDFGCVFSNRKSDVDFHFGLLIGSAHWFILCFHFNRSTKKLGESTCSIGTVRSKLTSLLILITTRIDSWVNPEIIILTVVRSSHYPVPVFDCNSRLKGSNTFIIHNCICSYFPNFLCSYMYSHNCICSLSNSFHVDGKKTKMMKIHVRLCFFLQVLSKLTLELLQSRTVSTTISRLEERTFWSWQLKKDQNIENPRKIFIFSENFVSHGIALQIWGQTPFWSRRTIDLKFDTQIFNFHWFFWHLFSGFPIVILETFREISIDHNFLNICRIKLFFDVLKSS